VNRAGRTGDGPEWTGFNPTTNWNTWANVNVTLTVTAGTNTVRLTRTTANGPANIDYIEIG
jgi:hypothetical protein